MFTTIERKLQEALNHMIEALEILDHCDASANVSSHLDLAICRLEDALGMAENAPGLQTELAEAFQTVPLESKPVLVWEQP